MSKIKGVHEQYDTKGRRGIRPGPSRPKVGLAGPTPLVGQLGPDIFPKTVFTTCQSKSVRGVSNVGKAVERLNLVARPTCMAGRPDKWASRAQSWPKHRLTPPIITPVLPLAEGVKKVRFSPL
jgi:hypothetical protein